LPQLFAKDLNAAMAVKNKPDRLVMLFDTHEKMWDEKRNSQGATFWYQDEWFRRLLRALDYKLGIVVVVAGRDCPVTQLRWPNASKFPIPEDYIDKQLVWHLSPADARNYLHKVEIDKADLADAVIKYASVNPDENWENLQIHPFYLGLCADVVLAERRRGVELLSSDFARIPKLENKTAELTDRLLLYVDREVRSAVHSLSACRAFDEDLYVKLGAGCHFQASSANFEVLTSFSFVWKSEKRGDSWYRIHDLLRRLDADRDNPKTRRAHEVLEGHYRELGDAAEAIFHANRLDWLRGVKEWQDVFHKALVKSRFGKCKSLLGVREELWIKSDYWLGGVSRSEGDYYDDLARYAEAKQEYLEAVAAYDRELIITPDDDGTLSNKGNALRCLGDLQAELSEFEAAKLSFSEALAAFNSALQIAPDDNYALHNKGNALRCLGCLQAQISEFEAAKQSYSKAIAVLNSALLIAPDFIMSLNYKGNALQSLGDLQAQLSEFEAAKQSYLEAIDVLNSVLQIAPDDISAFNNKARALGCLGYLQAHLTEFEAAKLSYSHAIAAFNSALIIAPDNKYALNSKGTALGCRGQLQAQLSEFEAAKQSYSEAISAYNSALLIAPDYIYALISKGIGLRGLGELQAKLSEFEVAKLSYSEAIAVLNSALQLAPDDTLAIYYKGYALRGLGDLQEQLSDRQEALKSWQDALEMFNRSLAIAPNNDSVRKIRDSLQESLNNLGEDTVSS
jgi:tetratricopeptide (TPR) repeat protein